MQLSGRMDCRRIVERGEAAARPFPSLSLSLPFFLSSSLSAFIKSADRTSCGPARSREGEMIPLTLSVHGPEEALWWLMAGGLLAHYIHITAQHNYPSWGGREISMEIGPRQHGARFQTPHYRHVDAYLLLNLWQSNCILQRELRALMHPHAAHLQRHVIETFNQRVHSFLRWMSSSASLVWQNGCN